MLNAQLAPATSNRIVRSLALRTQAAGNDDFIAPPSQIDNGDEMLYADKSGTYTKGVLQSGIGLVDLAAYDSFKSALGSGDPKDFEKIILGGPRTLNGPQGGLAFYLQCLDGSQFSAPPAPPLASEAYATELVELYWASLLRDVAFTDYATNMIAAKAAAELTSLPEYAGPRSAANKVTPDLLFRGGAAGGLFPGETVGPYVSQFLLQPTAFGSLPIVQRYVSNKPGVDFMLDPSEYLLVQNGQPTTKILMPTAPLYLHDGRGLAAYTHVDVLYQAYFVAYLVLNSLNVPVNPGNPYTNSKTQNGFATFGQPDIAATLTAVAAEALKAVWYQKWWVHLRHRPEFGRRHRPFDEDRRWRNTRKSQQYGANIAIRADKLHDQPQLLAFAGVSGGFADPSGLSDRAWYSRWRMHHRVEVLLRRQLQDPEGGRARPVQQRRQRQRLCCAARRTAAHRQWRIA